MRLDASRLARSLDGLVPSAESIDRSIWLLLLFHCALLMNTLHAMVPPRIAEPRLESLGMLACRGDTTEPYEVRRPPIFDLEAAQRAFDTHRIGGFQHLARLDTPLGGSNRPKLVGKHDPLDILPY